MTGKGSSVLAGFVLSAILAGSISLAVSLLAGHPLLIGLFFYSLAGSCGVLACAWHQMRAQGPAV